MVFLIFFDFPFFVFVYSRIPNRFSLFSSLKVEPGEVCSVRQRPFFYSFSIVADFNQIIYATGDWNEKCAILFSLSLVEPSLNRQNHSDVVIRKHQTCILD